MRLVAVHEQEDGGGHLLLHDVVAEVPEDFEHCIGIDVTVWSDAAGPLGVAVGGDAGDSRLPVLNTFEYEADPRVISVSRARHCKEEGLYFCHYSIL